ncbi:MAG: hypothetical protein IPL64_12190 [Flavobacteriales bacterium]|nr:hypothetical protein [Flavobacteriales bacterium]
MICIQRQPYRSTPDRTPARCQFADADETPEDNAAHFSDIVVGSYDPNDKLLSPAKLSPEVVAVGETPIEYTIRFQNTGTYLAERVVILDTLSEDLQWASIRFGQQPPEPLVRNGWRPARDPQRHQPARQHER